MTNATPLTAAEVSALRHDLRTPVNHIVGYCELLLEDAAADPDERRRNALRNALASARDVLALIDGTLSASGQDVTPGAIDALHSRLRTPHDRILAAMDALGDPSADEGFSADVQRIRHATGRLLATHRSSAPAAPARPASPARPGPSAQPASPAHGRILIVDDVEDNRDVLRRHLTRQGYAVDDAADGTAALRMAAEVSYDLMLLDVRMPGIDGHEVLTRIKRDPATRDIPVVMISAADELATIAACIEAGAEDFLPKPFDPVILGARASASVEKKRLRNLEVDYLKQVDRVVEAATAVERGSYAPGALAEVARRDDAIGRLARVFDAMAAGVRAREERLSEQVHTLRREIDQAKQGGSGAAEDELDAGTLLP
ncbi:MAG: response regulator, partial [Gemmatimonadales bacterium]